MEISDSLLCLFNAEIESTPTGARIEVPAHELDIGDIEDGEVYRVALLEPASQTGSEDGFDRGTAQAGPIPEPPVAEGDIREVEIEDMGEQGDGIARVERGYIVFVPDTDIGEERTIEITDVRENFAFGEVVDDREFEIES